MRELAGRAYFVVCLALGRLLRSARYSKARVVHEDGRPQILKRRVIYSPLLIWLGGSLMRILDAGVSVLPQHDWEAREREMYRILHGRSLQIHADGTLVLPCLAGETLAALLEDPELEASVRNRAIALAVAALAAFHRLGYTHGDAMAENVLVDLDAGVAHWFDFETVHESNRPAEWRRADDVRALLATCLVRMVSEKHAETVQLMMDAYSDQTIVRLLARSFGPVWRRPLVFHLAQAELSYRNFQEIARLLRARVV